MPTLAAWDITPDASLTPYPTPTVWDPLPTWAPWPTVDFPTWPTVETMTPFPTLGTTETPEGTPGSIATAAWEAGEGAEELIAAPAQFLDVVGNMTDDDVAGYGTVYSMTYNLVSTVIMPLRTVRGLQVYMPALWPMIVFVLAGLVYIAIIRLAKLALGVVGVVLDVIHKVVDTVLP